MQFLINNISFYLSSSKINCKKRILIYYNLHKFYEEILEINNMTNSMKRDISIATVYYLLLDKSLIRYFKKTDRQTESDRQ